MPGTVLSVLNKNSFNPRPNPMRMVPSLPSRIDKDADGQRLQLACGQQVRGGGANTNPTALARHRQAELYTGPGRLTRGIRVLFHWQQ